MGSITNLFEIVLTALACHFVLPLVVANQNEERD